MFFLRISRGLVACVVVLLGIAPALRADVVSAVQVTSASCIADVSNATGVVVTEALNGDCVVSFTAVGTTTWTRPADITTARVFVVAGGGGGGGHPSGDPGGGGGGGIVDVAQMQLVEATYDITVGKGGRGNNAGPCGNAWFSGEDGDPSQVATTSLVLVKAFGGGGGAGACDVHRPGGSGGGAHCGAPGGVVIAPQIDNSIVDALTYGNAGGQSYQSCSYGAGGGGGATQPGGDGTEFSAGNGGEGLAVDVAGTGTNVVYASGGGGAGGSAGIAVGLGGTNAGDGHVGTTAGKSGVANTGSGGGGHLCDEATGPICAGTGGSGIVIIRYANPNWTPTTTSTLPVVTTTTTTMVVPPETIAPETTAPTLQPIVPVAPLSQTDIAKVQKDAEKPAATPIIKVSPQTTVATTIAPLVANNSTTSPTPKPPKTSDTSAGVVVDGVESSATITRSNNALNFSGGGVTTEISGVSPSGERISLDADGNLRLSNEDQIVVDASGFVSGEEIGVWLFSTPTQLGSLMADATGKISGRFALPANVESGDHRLVLEGVNSDGSPIILGLGLAVGEIESSSTLARLLIAIPVALAIIFGLVIPTTLRRRRRESALV